MKQVIPISKYFPFNINSETCRESVSPALYLFCHVTPAESEDSLHENNGQNTIKTSPLSSTYTLLFSLFLSLWEHFYLVRWVSMCAWGVVISQPSYTASLWAGPEDKATPTRQTYRCCKGRKLALFAVPLECTLCSCRHLSCSEVRVCKECR